MGSVLYLIDLKIVCCFLGLEKFCRAAVAHSKFAIKLWAGLFTSSSYFPITL